MGIGAILFLIIGIFFIILGILAVNHYRLHPEKEGALIYILFPFILGIIGIMGAITGYIGLIILLLFIMSIISHIYSKYISIKNPEMKKKQEESREKALEIYKKHPPLYKLLRISRYMMYILLAFAIFLTAFIIIVVLFNVTF
ncbi:hypothetical protein [Methanobacterium sp.]|jgi:hypothetical protein|uniref:hypothetical protein n=1 Tax=Methanobacterium sp. TaxID=2164 RepID=UPI0031593E87